MNRIKLISCHRKPERSFFYKGKQFPLCSRCTGIYVGFMIMPLMLLNIVKLSMLTSILISMPTLLDGFVQSQTKYMSTNLTRLITGIFAGVGLIGISIASADFIAKYLF